MRILVLGGGAREHALTWKLAQNVTVDKMFCAPGNAGIEQIAECFPLEPTDIETTANLAEDLGIDLTVVGPEAPLVDGIVDEFQSRGLPVFGPSRSAARIEGSKSWAKEILAKAGAPTGRARTFTDPSEAVAYLEEVKPPYVVKADGLAAGKGVTVTDTRKEATTAIEDALVRGRFGEAGATVLLEEFLEGEELSLFCLTDGKSVIPLAAAQDYKRIFDGDEGPNTGGMGAYSPVAHLQDVVDRAVGEIMEPVVRTMDAEGVPFRGLLYGGVMVTAEGPKVFEFNCRFGDPETQAILPRLESDLAELLLATVEGNLAAYEPRWSPQACVTVVLASGGYPGEFTKGKPITGLERASESAIVFHAATARDGEQIVTDGGRVLAVSALGDDVADARANAYEAAKQIEFDGRYMRKDIASR